VTAPIAEPTRQHADLDARALFNPAFVATLVASAAAAHQKEHGSALPLPLAFVIAPWALTRPMRVALPGNIRAYLSAWAASQPLARRRFAAAVGGYADTTRAALRFGARHGLLDLTEAGIVATAPAIPDSAEAGECVRAAVFLARWLPRAGDTETVLALLGLRP
jgi:hypothetical protein